MQMVMSDVLRGTIRRYLTELPMSADPSSLYQRYGDLVVAMCEVENLDVQYALNEVAQEWRAPQREYWARRDEQDDKTKRSTS